MPFAHGGNWRGYQDRFGALPLDFSANISPFGVPEGVRRAVAEAAKTADRYPDPRCRDLRRAIAERENVPEKYVLCGNGAAELIFRAVLALRPKKALVPVPSFLEYEAALRAAGCELVPRPLRAEDGFRLGEDFPQAIGEGVGLVILCQPNNPTGRTVPLPLLRRVLMRCRERGAYLLLDECFLDLLDEPEKATLKGELEGGGLLLLRSFTKLYAMAGVRLGFCLCADGPLLDRMEESGPAWSVSSLAQAAGLAALQESDYREKTRAFVRAERPYLMEGLEALGLTVIPGEANFLLFRCKTPLGAPLAARGILLRNCGNYRRLDESWYRAAVRTHEDNARLLKTLKEVLQNG